MESEKCQIHGGNILSEEHLLKKWEIGVRIAARGNFKDSSMNRSLCNSWNIPLSVLQVKAGSPIYVVVQLFFLLHLFFLCWVLVRKY